MTKTAMRGVPVTLIPAGTTGTGAGTAIVVPSSFKYHTFTLKATGTISTGKVKIETADLAAYASTWALVGAETILLSDTELVVTFIGLLQAIRANVSVGITGGGSVAVTYVGT